MICFSYFCILIQQKDSIFCIQYILKQRMEDSSDEQNVVQQYFLDNPNDSHNQTAASIQQNQNDLQAQDKDQYAQQTLRQFYKSQLLIHADMRFDDLDKDSNVFKNGIIGIYPPQPLVYFLPYTILVDIRQKLPQIRDRIKKKYQQKIQTKQIELNMYVDSKDQLFISLHSSAELIFYKIRRISVKQDYHKYIDCLDKDILVDRLFNFYKVTHQKFFFEQISVFFMYWAYTKRFLSEDYLSPSAIKMLIICLFLNFGYGIKNVIPNFEKNFWKKQSKCMEMSKTNRKGQSSIDRDILKYKNYSVQQRKGLYIVSQQKYQLIHHIVPILYPIGQRKQNLHKFQYAQSQLKFFQEQAKKSYKKLKQKGIKITRYNLLCLLMKKLHNYFNYPNKLIIDLKRKDVIFVQNSNQFLLQIQHPVFNYVISAGLANKGSTARRVKGQLNQLIKKMKQNQEAIENILYLFQKR